MSNLQLPDLSFRNLDKLAPANGSTRKIGYNTYVHRSGDEIEFIHHGTVVATVGIFSVDITPHGYATSTTSGRISKVIRDNGISPEFVVGIRQGDYVLRSRDTLKKGEVLPFGGITFRMVSGVWTHDFVSALAS